jgi:hypothetical protein
MTFSCFEPPLQAVETNNAMAAVMILLIFILNILLNLGAKVRRFFDTAVSQITSQFSLFAEIVLLYKK